MTETPPTLDILYVGTLPPHQGGTAVVGSQLLVALAGLGHRIFAIAPITEAALRSGDPFADQDHGLEVARFVMPYLDTSPDTPPPDHYREWERRRIEQLFRRLTTQRQPDVVVIGRESFAPHVSDLARALSLPSVLLIQGATTMGVLNGSYPAELAVPLLESIRQIDVAVTSARHMQEALAELGLAGVKRIPNPVDLRRFRPSRGRPALRRAVGLDDDDVVVAHLSNLKPIKRSLDIAEAAQIALREDPRLRFVIVGEGHDREALEEACAARGVGARFRFLDWIEHQQVPDVLNSADIVVMPSAGEAQALVYLEAQACERTLIASDIPAAREVIEDGQSGLLFRTGDAADLAAKILLAASDPELRARLGRQARAGLGRHSLPRVVAAYAQLFKGIAAQDDEQVAASTP